MTSNAFASTPLNVFGTLATYTCVDGYRFDNSTVTVMDFLCGDAGWEPGPRDCIGKSE